MPGPSAWHTLGGLKIGAPRREHRELARLQLPGEDEARFRPRPSRGIGVMTSFFANQLVNNTFEIQQAFGSLLLGPDSSQVHPGQ